MRISSFTFVLAASCLCPSLWSQSIEPAVRVLHAPSNLSLDSRPFSRIGIEGGISPLGIGIQTATNLNRHLNLRFARDQFGYTTNFETSGVNASAKLNLTSSRVALDYYPTHLGFRLSAGALVQNGNKMTAAAVIPGGNSFTLDGDTFFSASPNTKTGATPVSATGGVRLNTNSPALSLSTGWGNMVRQRGHWSFPVEIGAAFTGSPKVYANLTGWACADQAQTECANLADTSNSVAKQAQDDLAAQLATWKKDIDPVTIYPILSFGVSYSFRVR